MTVSTRPLARDTMAYVLAGGRGSRLNELTDIRAKPAVYFGGKARIIDFSLSNALNSGIRRFGVATQYKAHSLIRHLQYAWNFFRPERNESFDILPASQRVSETQWYEGTADAVFQNIDIIEAQGPEYMLILAGDHIYKMDFELMLRQHATSKARRHHRLHGGAARGSLSLRRHGDRRQRPDHRLRRKAGRSTGHAGQAGHLAGVDGHLRLQNQIPDRPAEARRRRSQLQPRLRQGYHSVPGQARQGGGASFLAKLRAGEERARGLLARCRHA
ncbi:MAG: sugar phosphate nucleotidyltransferase [Asticcacaulis sp.]